MNDDPSMIIPYIQNDDSSENSERINRNLINLVYVN